MPVEVSCPGCSAKLKAPENMIGKKAKCKKCFTSFRIPGPAGMADSVGESQMLSVVSAPTPPLPPAPDDVPMARAVEDDLPVEPRPSASAARVASPPAPDVAALPSADPFDFTAPAPKSLQPAKAPGGSRPGVGPPRTAPSPPAPPKTLPPPTPPAPAAPEVLSLDDAEPLPVEEPVVEIGPPAMSDDPFSFAGDAALAVEEPRAKGKPKKKGSDEAKGVQSKDKKTQPVAEAIEEPVEETVGFAAAAATSDDPFSFSAGPPAPEEKQKESPRSKKKAKNEDEEEPQEGGRRYQRAGEKKSRTLFIAIILGVLALGGIAAAAFVFMNRKEAEPPKKSTEKKEEPPPPEAPKEEKKDEPKDKKDPPRKSPPKKDPSPKTPGDPVSGSPVAMLALPPKLPTFQFRPLPPKVETAQQPSNIIQVDVPYEKIKRFFPSDKRTQDSVVVWQSSPGISGVGERLTADSYSGTTGSRVGRLEFEGDGKQAKCSLSHDAQFFAAAAEGKVSVWKLGDKPTKVMDAFDPYADKPAHKKAGLAAVFLPNNPNHLVTVTSAGAIHLFDIAGKQQLGEYVPENGVSGRVSEGKSVTIDEDGTSVVVAAGGAIHQVATATLALSWKLELGGEAGRSFGIGTVGVPGRVCYAFETDTDGKKEKAVLFCLPQGKPTIFRWPDPAGEPTNANWAGTEFASIGTTRGSVWVEVDGKSFVPLALADVPGGKTQHSTTEFGFWYLMPHPKDPTKSIVVEVGRPPDGLSDYRAAAEARNPLHTVRIDAGGLSR